MKVFLINLDKDVERLAAADAQFRAVGVEYERFSAVYVKYWSRAEKNRHVNRFRWWCATGRPPRDGEIGCALSHYTLFRRMVAENIPIACMIEDDVVLDSRMKRVLEEVERSYPKGVPFVGLLSNHSDPVGQNPEVGDCGFTTPEDVSEFLLKRETWDQCTEGYVVSLEGAKALLRANYPLITPCDIWPRWCRQGNIELYHVFPTVCSQNKDNFNSTVAVNGIWVKDMSVMRLVFYRVGRLIGRSLDRVMVRFKGF